VSGHGVGAVAAPVKSAHKFAVGQDITYWRAQFGATPALVVSIYPNGRMTLRVNQGGAVPWYTARNVRVTSCSVKP
jgi:hypothetical protein